MWNKISDFIARHHLINNKGLHLVALSGGADSVALLLILDKLGYHVEAAHCNFRLRGEESDRDEAFVRQLCAAHQIPLHLAHFDTREYAALHKVSIEMAARELRYRYFEQLRLDIGAERICVAHHRDDAVETLLMNLMRGAGIHGLTGIRAKNGYIVRPLLCVSRQEIEAYLQGINQPYVTDSTNLVDDVLRNKVRLNLIPLMQQILPNSSENISHTAAYLGEAENLYNSAIQSALSQLVKPEKPQTVLSKGEEVESVNIEMLQTMPSPECLLYEWLSPYGFTSAQIQQISTRLDEIDTGRMYLSPSHQLLVERGELLLAPQQKPIPSIKIPETGTYIFNDSQKFRFVESADVEVSKSSDCATFDKGKVSFPLTIRAIQEGDRFHPYGMRGSKLVSDLLTDQKVSLLEKRRQLVVTDRQGEIIWLVGRRTDDRYKVDADTQQVLSITLL